jgi:AmmeMemoRadiSam system protein A
MLTPQQRRQLLQIARESIAGVFEGRRPAIDLRTFDEDLTRPSGAFVTLHAKDGDLRGCIGTIEPVAPLVQAVAANAVNAAFRDPRFPPLTPSEFADVHLEISVMSPIVPVDDPESIEVGRDGLIVRRGSSAGLLLPQVATEQGWDRETFLRHTCLKAGLPADSWRDGSCRLERFSAEVFGE